MGTTDGLPPGDPGGGMTGVLVPLWAGGLTVIPGSTFGGSIVPFCRDSRLLMSLAGGAIFSGGGEAALGGATCTVGLTGGAGWGFCAIAGAAARIIAANESVCAIRVCPRVISL